MINTKLTAYDTFSDEIILENTDGDTVARFSSDAFFYIVTGFKTVADFNAHQNEHPVKFLVWPRAH